MDDDHFPDCPYPSKKYAWKPILKMIKDRKILSTAHLNLRRSQNKKCKVFGPTTKKFLRKHELKRDMMMKEARDMKDSIVGEAKGKAKEEADKILASARGNSK